MDQELLGRWDEIEEIDIRFNNFKCDCETQWFLDVLIPRIKSIKKTALTEDIE